MMTLLTGLVLAIFAGTMVQYGDSIISLLSGQTTESTEDDHFTALAGGEQQLDVLANDVVRGPLAVTSVPACGDLRPGAGQMLFYRSDASCVGEQTFTYCVATAEGCTDKAVTISVVGSTAVASASPAATTSSTPAETPAAVPAESMQAAAAEATTTFAPQPAPATNNNGSDAEGANSSAPQVMVDPGASMASANDAAPEVDMVVAGIRPPMLAAPQIGEIVAPNDAAAQLRAEMARQSATPDSTPASGPAVETAVTATMGQMDTSFTAPSLGDEGVSLGRSVVVAGTSFGGSAGGPEVEGASDVAIAGFQPSAPVATAPAPALSSAAPASDAVEVLGIGPIVQEDVQVLAALAIPTETGAAILTGTSSHYAGAQVLLASATLPPSDSIGAATDMAVQVLDAFPTLAAVQISDVGVTLDASSDAALPASSAPLVNPANEPSAVLPPVADTSTSSPTALVATATTLLPSLESGDSTPARPRLLMRHVAMNSAPGALDGAAGDLSAGPSIDFSTAPPTLQTASLEPEVIAPTESLPGDTTCDISLDTLVRPGAEIELIVGAACRPNQMFTISHAAIAFSEMTGADGTAIVQFPALERSAEILVEFADGASHSTSLIVPDTETILRAGISWRGVADIELNAYEFGAPADSPGHISPQAPRDFRAARILGGGFLTELGSLDVAGAAHASVYSMPLSRATPEGIITLSLRMGDAGADCGGSTELTTFRSENAAAFARQQSVQLAACGAVLPTAELMGLVDDLWTAAR